MIRGIIILVVLGAIALVTLVGVQKAEAPQADAPEEEGELTACTLEAKLCPDGSAVGRTGPDCSFAPCPDPSAIPPEVQEHINEKADLIGVTSLYPNDIVSSPVTLTGFARGPWFFEATFPIIVTDWDGRIIGEGYATAQDEWMTTEFVPFEATVTFSDGEDAPYPRGTIILKKSNASGLQEHDDALEIPVRFE